MAELIHTATHLILAPSAIAAMHHMAQHRHSFSDPERLWYYCYGNLPTQEMVSSLRPMLPKMKVILLYQDDLLGKIASIKIACWLKGRNVQISYRHSGMLLICFNGRCYEFTEDELGLNRFEKRVGLRSRIKTYKAVG